MKKGFLAYFTMGYPDLKTTEEAIKGAIKGGATGIEIGIPFSDPVADGETIQYAHHIALKNGTKIDDVISLLNRINSYLNQANFYIMAYLNTIINMPFGMEKFLKEIKDYGVKGLILPDLPFSEVRKNKFSINFPIVLFATPDTDERDLKEYSLYNPPFIYYIARYGTTGERETLPKDIKEKIKSIREKIDIPLYIGFGISKPEHVAELYEVADGVIVGSHLIRLMIQHEGEESKNIGKIIQDEVKRLLTFS